MTKTTTNGNLNFHADRKIYVPPVIIESFIDDEGRENYILANGNTTLSERYNSVWHPASKGIINWKAKGNTIESPQRKY